MEFHMKPKFVRISVIVTEEIRDALRALSEESTENMSLIVRKAIKEYFKLLNNSLDDNLEK